MARNSVPNWMVWVTLGVPLFLLWRCSVWWDELGEGQKKREQNAAWQREFDAANARARDEQARVTRIAEEAERARLASERAAAKLAELKTLTAGRRAQLLQKCASELECPFGNDPDLLYEAAKSSTERLQLERTYTAIRKAIDRADAPLLCCDGDLSPTCTCGHPKRGCCSHHGGVCGCSADQATR